MSERISEEELLELIEGDDERVSWVEVEGASGTTFTVYPQESDWFNANLNRYLEEYRFENVADLQDLDRLLGLELLSYRYTRWLLQGTDYENLDIDEKGTREHKDKIDTEIRQVKKHMGMGRSARLESESESTADYLRNLLRRAGEFGVHRDNQIAKAIDLFMELKKLIGLHDRVDEEERLQLGVTEDGIMSWIREVAIPEFDQIDAAYRVNQRLWIREVS